MQNLLAVVVLLALAACGREPAAPPTQHAANEDGPPLVDPLEGLEPEPKPTPPPSCGPLDCELYDDAASAFSAVLKETPAVLAVGEMHALEAAADVPSATKRFREELLPLLVGRASELLLELWVSDPDCQKKVDKVEKQQKEVTAGQAASNQNEFVALGDAAHAVGIQPRLLEPTCEDYDRIAKAGDDAVILMLETIAKLSESELASAVTRNESNRTGKMVVAYGGAMHNDVAPTKAAAAFSFGPALAKKISGGYVALDLVVPEYVRDSKLWQAQPWYEHFDPNAHQNKVRLYRPGPGEYALIFARTTDK
jgi:hypothetical protein